MGPHQCHFKKLLFFGSIIIVSWAILGIWFQLSYLHNSSLQNQYHSFGALAANKLISDDHTAQVIERPQKAYAYVFYATKSTYACGAFVAIATLRETGTPINDPIDFVLLTYGEASKNPEIKEQAAKLNVKIKEVKSMPLRNAKGSNPYYANVMVKLRIFQLFEYDRIIFMDSDMMIRQNLDHLFYTLPKDVHLAASRVTDTQKIDSRVFCSCFIVLTPTTKIWDRIMAYYKQNDGGYLKENLLDMDLLNKEFGSDVILLPGTYAMLTSIWEDKMDQRSPQETNEMYQQLVGKPTNVTTKDAIYEEAKVLHFTPNKPMVEKKLENIKQHKPRAYPQYYRTFEEYFSLSRYVCPFIRDSPSINNK